MKKVKIRTIEEVLEQDPNARFSCNNVKLGVFDGDEIYSQIRYRIGDFKPFVTYCVPHLFKMNAKEILERESWDWEYAWDGWELQCSSELQSKLQLVLDEIVKENELANTSYTEGEELDIDDFWKEINGNE